MPQPTLMDVKVAMANVWAKWGTAIPSGLNHYRAEDIVIFASESQWNLAFTMTYVKVFRPANQFKELPRQFIDFVLGFVTPVADHEQKKIYLSPKVQGYTRSQQRMILSHEYIHWLSHGAFYPDFYVIGGDNPFRVEGITQWLTVECGYTTEFAAVPAYQDEYLKTAAWLGSSTVRKNAMLEYIFKGVKADLSQIKR